MNPAEDPRFTAYADGALPRGDSRRFERELSRDPAALAELAELEALQNELRAAFADPTSPPITAIRRAPALPRGGALRQPGWIGALFVAFCVCIVGATLLSTGGQSRGYSDHAAALDRLRRIHAACSIYSAAHGDKYPAAPDVWEFARQLALAGGLNDARVWTLAGDPAAKDDEDLTTVLDADGARPHPEFAAAKPAFGVVLSGVDEASSAVTPVAWTRGLRDDGTWAPDSPFGSQGGYVLLLSGEVRAFFDGPAEFTGRDGRPTRRLGDALPTGARTGEYAPTSAEARLWSDSPRGLAPSVLRAQRARTAFFAAAACVLAGAMIWQLARRRLRFGELLMAALVALLLVMLGLTMR